MNGNLRSFRLDGILTSPATLLVLALSPLPLSAQTLLEVREDRYWRGHSREANATFQSEAAPGGELYRQLGQARQKNGQLPEAIAAGKQAAELYRRDGSEAARRQLAGVLVEMAQAHLDLGQLPAARPLLAEALALARELEDAALSASASSAACLRSGAS